MQDFFCDRKVICKINGKPDEKIVFKRRGKTNTRFNDNYIFECVLQDNTSLTNGDIIIDDTGVCYFVIARRDGYLSKIAQMQKTNSSVIICKLVDKFVGTVNKGKTEQLLYSNVPVFYEDISGNMRLYDSGLLPTTTKRILMHNSNVVSLDYRIKLNGSNYKINDINTSKYPGLLYIQVEIDNRVVVV